MSANFRLTGYRRFIGKLTVLVVGVIRSGKSTSITMEGKVLNIGHKKKEAKDISLFPTLSLTRCCQFHFQMLTGLKMDYRRSTSGYCTLPKGNLVIKKRKN